MSNVIKVFNDSNDKFEPLKVSDSGLICIDEHNDATFNTMNTHLSLLAGTVNQGNEQKVSVSSENIGSHGNVCNNISLSAGAYTNTLSIAEIAKGNLFYSDTATSSSDGLIIEVSVDNTNWYVWGQLYPFTSGSTRTASVLGGSAHGLRYFRLKNNSNTDTFTNVSATLCGSH